MTTATAGEEYKILHQTAPLIKAARIFSLIWILIVTCPAVYLTVTHAGSIKEFIVVKTVDKAHAILTEQYSTFSDNVLKSVNIQKYTSKIQVPEIKLDKIEQATGKTKKVASALTKLGIKEAAKIEDSTAAIQKQVDKVNKQLIETTDKIKATLNTEIQNGLKQEVSSLAEKQIKKQLALSEASYNKLLKGRYGLASEEERAATNAIYKELASDKKSIFKDLLNGLEEYYDYIFYALIALVAIATLIPPFIVNKLAKKFSATFTQCPHCHKVFVSKQNAANILKMLKFW